jgi:hypothetical protein
MQLLSVHLDIEVFGQTLRALFSERVGCRSGAAAALGKLDKYAEYVLLAVSCIQ